MKTMKRKRFKTLRICRCIGKDLYFISTNR